MQHTRRLTGVQHTKYYPRASYNCAAHKDGSRVAHKIELACSTQKLTLVWHASSVLVTQQKYKNTRVLPHASVNLDVSYTVYYKQNKIQIFVSCDISYTCTSCIHLTCIFKISSDTCIRWPMHVWASLYTYKQPVYIGGAHMHMDYPCTY